MPAPIEAKVFQNKNTIAVARSLLGKLLVRAGGADGEIRARITEVEAYHGATDLACHASRGRTPRIGVDYAGPVWSAKKWRFVLSSTSSGERSPRLAPRRTT